MIPARERDFVRCSKDALARILEAFIAKELQPYVQTIPEGYYRELFRLRGAAYTPTSVKRPQYFGHLTNDIIYARLAPQVLEELSKRGKRTPSVDSDTIILAA